MHIGATVACSHGGQASPTVSNARVLVAGQPSVTQPAPYVVAGCSMPNPPTGPCATAQFVTASVRVTSGGLPLLLTDSLSIATPTGSPLIPSVTQTRATAT